MYIYIYYWIGGQVARVARIGGCLFSLCVTARPIFVRSPGRADLVDLVLSPGGSSGEPILPLRD